MKRVLFITAAILGLAACGDGAMTTDACHNHCKVVLDDSWTEIQPGIYEHETVGQLGTLQAGNVCEAEKNGEILPGAWLVEDPGSWVQDFPGSQTPQTYTVQTKAKIGKVTAPLSCVP